MEMMEMAAMNGANQPGALNISLEDFFQLRPETSIDRDGVGHVWMHGMMLSKPEPILEKLGLATSYETLTNDFENLGEEAVAVMLHSNSPGGSVVGLSEAAGAFAALSAARGIPTAAHSEFATYSAAYYIASGADNISAEPSAGTGNIGTILAYADESGFWDAMGVKFEAIANDGADLKSTFHTTSPMMTESQRSNLQEGVNQRAGEFQTHVLSHRSVDPEVFRAGWYSGQQAVDLGLGDGIMSAEAARQQLLERI